MFAKKTGKILLTVDQFAEFFPILTRLLAQIVKKLDLSTVQYWIGHEKELGKVLKQVLSKNAAIDEQVADWVQFYQAVFGLELDPAKISLPAFRDGFGWIVLVTKGLTRNAVFELCKKRFPSWRYYDNLDTAVTGNDREATETYAIRVRDRVEADEENRNLSANRTKDAGIKGLTNLERMLLELWYHWKTEQHLDQKTVTICAGSRYADGYVPTSNSHVDKFKVYFVHPDFALDVWRVREVVSK